MLEKKRVERPEPKEQGEKKNQGKFKTYEIGLIHVDNLQICAAEGELYLFVAIDRKNRYSFYELYPRMDAKITVSFLRNIIANIPYKVHAILTDNDVQFSYKFLIKHFVTTKRKPIHSMSFACSMASDID